MNGVSYGHYLLFRYQDVYNWAYFIEVADISKNFIRAVKGSQYRITNFSSPSPSSYSKCVWVKSDKEYFDNSLVSEIPLGPSDVDQLLAILPSV